MQASIIDSHNAVANSSSGNSTDSPTYQCHSGGIPQIDTNAPYCIVQGGAKRMDTCCSLLSNGSSPVNFQPDCYSWCNVNLPPGIGQDPLVQALDEFTSCLEEGQGAGYFPATVCQNGTEEASSPNASTTSQPATSTQPAAPTTSHSSADHASVGGIKKMAVGLLVLSAAAQALL